jgi:predicted HicB family RNase H-like nuclease
MDILKYNGFEGSAELDMASLTCRGKLLFVDDLVTYQASSPEGLQREFEAAVDDYLETCRELGREPQRPFKGLFNVRVSPERHKAAVLRAASDGMTLNEVINSALELYLTGKAEIVHTVKVELEAAQKQFGR